MKHFKTIGTVDFPDSKLHNVNMMPFIMDDPESLPAIIRDYWSLIKQCNVERNAIGYLTVRENFIIANATQSREGVHTEGWGDARWGGSGGTAWGGGNNYEEGIFMASTVAATTEVWDMRIDNPKIYGDCSHLNLKFGYKLDANELIWLTDRTPHRNVPLDRPIFRQYFRLVTEDVSVWYALHSTPNPLGVVAKNISYENKFKNTKGFY